jgi:hypothetical protein
MIRNIYLKFEVDNLGNEEVTMKNILQSESRGE